MKKNMTSEEKAHRKAFKANLKQKKLKKTTTTPTKVAFCFSGQLRTWRKCIHTWQAFFAELKENHGVTDIDVFCHIWDHNTLQHGIKHSNNAASDLDESVLSDDEISLYLVQLNPVAYKISNASVSKSATQQTVDQVAKDIDNHYGECNNEWLSPQFYSIMYAAHLKKMHEIKHNFNYDVCVRMRNDLYLGDTVFNHTNADLNKILHPKFNTVYSCHTHVDTSSNVWFNRRLGDIFWCADSPTFDKMSNFYHWLPTIGSKAIRNHVDNHVGPEHIFYYYAKMFNILVDGLTSDPKLARDAEYIKNKKDAGLGPLGSHEILC